MSQVQLNRFEQPEASSAASGKLQTLISLALAGFVLIFALALPLNNAWDIWCNRDLEHNGQLTTARFGDSFRCPTKVAPDAICHALHYEVRGKSYTGRTTRTDLDRALGVQIRYAPVNPDYFRFTDQPLSRHWDDDLAQRLLISCGLCLLFSLASLAGLINSWQKFKGKGPGKRLA